MTRIPERAILVRRDALKRLNRTSSDLSKLLAFEVPFGETDEVLVYGPYFDFEFLQRLAVVFRTLVLSSGMITSNLRKIYLSGSPWKLSMNFDGGGTRGLTYRYPTESIYDFDSDRDL